MMPGAVNIHGTAIVIGTTGLLFVGPSGSGKSTMAHAFLAAADREGFLARLVADDQVFLSSRNGRIIAGRPKTIAGLLELRGSGIVSIASVPHALLHCAVRPVGAGEMERLPAEGETEDLGDGLFLPLLKISRHHPDPLAVLGRFLPLLGRMQTKSR